MLAFCSHLGLSATFDEEDEYKCFIRPNGSTMHWIDSLCRDALEGRQIGVELMLLRSLLYTRAYRGANRYIYARHNLVKVFDRKVVIRSLCLS